MGLPMSLQCPQTPCVILGASAGLFMRQVPHGGTSHFPARALAHMPAARVPPPTPSPDGLCQASSAASLTPQQLLGQGCVRTQLARVPPSLGAAGMLRGMAGWGVVLPRRPNISVHVWAGAACGSEDRELEERSSGQESPTGSILTLWPYTTFTSWLTQFPPPCLLPTRTLSWAEALVSLVDFSPCL